MEIVCKINNLVLNYSQELAALYSARDKDDTQMQEPESVYLSKSRFVKSKYDMEDPSNIELFKGWVDKVWRINDLELKNDSELEALKQSYMAVLYIIPQLGRDRFGDEMKKIAYLRNVFSTMPIMWASHGVNFNVVEGGEDFEKDKSYTGSFIIICVD